ncbi:hypothetical protein BGX38DRAFT_1230181 [Terfezia claveryi]|nr:hypothetical protein BGX38DRAFT_1230181 [Terfezia claveryi]
MRRIFLYSIHHCGQSIFHGNFTKVGTGTGLNSTILKTLNLYMRNIIRVISRMCSGNVSYTAS